MISSSITAAAAACSCLSGADLAIRAQVSELACRGGVGRAGLIAACLLLYTQQAIKGEVSPHTHCFLI